MQCSQRLLQSSAVTINDGDDEDDNVTNTGLNFPRVDVLASDEFGPTILEADDATVLIGGGRGPKEAGYRHIKHRRNVAQVGDRGLGEVSLHLAQPSDRPVKPIGHLLQG